LRGSACYGHLTGKDGLAFLNFDMAHLPCPVVHVTKQPLVDGWHVRQIKLTLDRLFAQFGGAQKRQAGFGFVESSLILDAQ